MRCGKKNNRLRISINQYELDKSISICKSIVNDVVKKAIEGMVFSFLKGGTIK